MKRSKKGYNIMHFSDMTLLEKIAKFLTEYHILLDLQALWHLVDENTGEVDGAIVEVEGPEFLVNYLSRKTDESVIKRCKKEGSKIITWELDPETRSLTKVN